MQKYNLVPWPETHFGSCQKTMIEIFMIGVKYFCKNIPLHEFDRVLSTPLKQVLLFTVRKPSFGVNAFGENLNLMFRI